MTGACHDAWLATPSLEEIDTRFRVTLGTERVGEPIWDEKEQAILKVLEGGGGHVTSEVKAIGLTPRATRTRLARLAARECGRHNE